MMTQRIENAINVFLDAINNGTLAKGTCCACAIGNLIADKINYKIEELDHDTSKPNGVWWDYVAGFNKKAEILNKLDFTINEVIEIEKAFENNTKINYLSYYNSSKKQIREDQINGLKAVIEVMMSFDDVKEDVDAVFTKKAELIPV